MTHENDEYDPSITAKQVCIREQISLLFELALERLIDCGTIVGKCTCGKTIWTLADMSLSQLYSQHLPE